MASKKSKASKVESKKKSVAPEKSVQKTPPTAFKSTEFVQNSDSGSNSSNEEEGETDGSSEGSESEEDAVSTKPAGGSSKANGKLPAPAGSSSSSEGDSDESSEDEEEDSEDSKNTSRKAPAPVEPTKRPAKESTTRTLAFTAPAPFQPPRGFDSVSLEGSPKASQLLKKSNLEGKQIWYFTAPASVPISSIKAMSLANAEEGKAVLVHEDGNYGFIKDTAEDTTYTKIVVPSASEGVYRYAPKSIDRVFHLQQIFGDQTTEGPSRATIPAKKPIREQPRGLIMRFRPIGFGSGETGRIGSSSPSASDDEMEDRSALPIRRAVSKSQNVDKSESDCSDSDEDMEDAPPVVVKAKTKTKTAKSSSSGKSEKEPTLKRKHGEEDKKSKYKKAEKKSEKRSKQSISVN